MSQVQNVNSCVESSLLTYEKSLQETHKINT